jgi:hypothetical protein
MDKSHFNSRDNCFNPNILEIGQKGYCQVWIWITWGQMLGHTAKILKNPVNTQKVTNPVQISLKLVRKGVLMISQSVSSMGY